MASNGYIVFMIDHHDGSNTHTIKGPNNEDFNFDTKAPNPATVFDMGGDIPIEVSKEEGKKIWHDKVMTRIKEIS